MSLTTVLQKFERVKETTPGKFVALCTGHADKSPSLTIRETDDGRVLLHCFAGCPTEHVLAGAGLTFADLFPERPRSDRPRGPSRAQQSEIDLALIVVEIAKAERTRGVQHSESDLATIRKSVALLKNIAPSQRKLSQPRQSRDMRLVFDLALHEGRDHIAFDAESTSLCDGCGNVYVMRDRDSMYCAACSGVVS